MKEAGPATMTMHWKVVVGLFFFIEIQRLVEGFLQKKTVCGVLENVSFGRNKNLWRTARKEMALNHKEQEIQTLKKMKFIRKRKIAFPFDAKYRNRIKEHCGDIDSYYFSALNECYRIYQTPYSNLDANYVGDRNKLAYGTSQYDYMYNCWELYRGKLLDIREAAIGEKMELVKNMALQFYSITGQSEAIRVGFMITKNYEIMSQNGTFYDVLDEVYVKMHSTEPCNDVCCIVMKLAETGEIEMEQASCDHSLSIPNFFCQKEGNA